MRVALIHYWLVGMRGGEKVLEALARFFPDAVIFTHVYDPDAVSPALRQMDIRTTWISKLPGATHHYQKYLPLMPRALEDLDLTGFDLVISSESGPAKGVIVPPDAVHICYCHSPMRYIWDQYHVYRQSAGGLTKLLMPHVAHRLRQWDVSSAARVDAFMANSSYVAQRIEKYWRRDASVVHPPVAVSDFTPSANYDDFYLWVGELVAYKKPDLAVEAFTKLGKPLKIVGGSDAAARRLAAGAGPNVEFCGHVSLERLRCMMARCKALIFPGEEDFGIVPVEVMASGRPIIAYGRGGATETVVDRRTGLLFNDQSVDGLVAAVQEFERERLDKLDPVSLVRHARKFDEDNFAAGVQGCLAQMGVTSQNHPLHLNVGARA